MYRHVDQHAAVVNVWKIQCAGIFIQILNKRIDRLASRVASLQVKTATVNKATKSNLCESAFITR